MWITFKSCIFAFWNNNHNHNRNRNPVVNYIQILYLCILKQQVIKFTHVAKVVNYIQILYLCILKQRLVILRVRPHCCELHSNLVSLHSETTLFGIHQDQQKLWITFKSCIFAFWNNLCLPGSTPGRVVNYIQILYLCILKQPDKWQLAQTAVVNYIQILYLCILKQQGIFSTGIKSCCELHSNLVSLHSETTLRVSFISTW